MSKQAKRISKLLKNPRNALVLGSAFDFLNELVGLFSTIFVINENPNRIRHKTVVYRDSIDGIGAIQDVDIIFIDVEYTNEIKNLHSVWRKSNPVVLLGCSKFSDKKILKLMNSENYYAVEQTDHYIIWKTQ